MRPILLTLFVSVAFLVHAQPNMTITTVQNPISGCEVGGTSEVIQIIVYNAASPPGNTALSGSVTMNYTINGGPVVSQTLTALLSAQATWNFQFNPIDLSACDTFDIVVWAYHPNDPDHSNDTIAWQFINSCTVVPGVVNGSDTVCQGMNTGTLELNGWQQGNIADWEFSTDGGATWTGTGVTDSIYTYTNLVDSTRYRVIIDGVYCPNDTACCGLIEIDLPSDAGTLTGDINICEGTDTMMYVVPGLGWVVEWQYSPDGGASWTSVPSSNNDSLVIPAASADSWFQVLVQNGVCPPDTTAVAFLDVDLLPNAGTASSSAPTVCSVINADSIQVTGYSGTIVGWISSLDSGATWTNTGDVSTNYIFTNILDTTTYAIVVSNGLCPNDTSNYVTINTLDAPNVFAGNDTVVDEGDTIWLNASGGVVGFWQPSQYLDDSTSYNPMLASPVDTNSHTYDTLTYIFYAANAIGCINADTVVVVVIPDRLPPNLWDPVISNIITANNDGINDTWYVESIQAYPGTEVFIYNIWGQEIYSALDYQNDFDGTYRGTRLPNGVYKYVIDIGGIDRNLKGTFTILGDE